MNNPHKNINEEKSVNCEQSADLAVLSEIKPLLINRVDKQVVAETSLLSVEKNIESLLAIVSELYEKVHRVEKVLIDEDTIEVLPPEIDESGPEGLLIVATNYIRESGRCSVSLLQKRFRISYKRAFVLLDVLEANGVIAPYRGEVERVVNQW